MKRGEVPITEETYQHILQHAENYFIETDQQNPKYFRQVTKRNTKLSTATPFQSSMTPFEDFIKFQKDKTLNTTISAVQPQKNNSPKKKEKKGKKFLINDADLQAAKFAGKEKNKLAEEDDGEEIFLPGSLNAKVSGDKNHLLAAITDIFATTEKMSIDYSKRAAECVEQDFKPDLGSISDVPEDYYEPLVFPSSLDKSEQSFREIPENYVKRCSLTGVPIEGKTSADLVIPFHDELDEPLSNRYRYLNQTKEAISERFSVEDKIESGEGVMLDINDDILFSLSYDRKTIAGRSVLSVMVEKGLEASSELYAAIVDGYGRGGNESALETAINEAQTLECDVTEAVVNRTISSYGRTGNIKLLDESLDWAHKNEVPLEHTTLNSAMYAYSQAKKFASVIKIRDELIANGYPTNPDHEPAILHMYATQGNIDAIDLALQARIDAGNPPTSQTFGAIIQGLTTTKKFDTAVRYYKQMNDMNLSASEQTLNFAFTCLHKTRDLEGATKCLWLLREYGYPCLDAKKAEGIIDLLCEQKQFSHAIQLLGLYKNISFMLKPRNFTFLLQGLLETEKLRIISTLQPKMRWPCYIALSMIYGPKAVEANTNALVLIAKEHNVSAPVVEGCIFYYMQKNDADRTLDVLDYCKKELPQIIFTPPLYVFAYLTLFRNQRVAEALELLKYMESKEISISTISITAKKNLSATNFHELYEEFSQRAGIDLYDQLKESKKEAKLNIL
eukprot:CAMPEP_0117005602 /NCGR_PEP_ID=MMETSP0472-20121206/6151_1 /TAXON_ID=693140 ORGANISM="Tiarina fusus, Strain LIS" /NCGR_SAMPLE_ID=MMETSP0472 /ASSEMBLY_ACC=CAM_ASM_000603 /LENGTH=731 /DNA_ID=CAMNT_0004706873 /DNA_START=190 /DNA_END=2382 /DNA_ORIENTATION=+